jgi:hypothetical protein
VLAPCAKAGTHTNDRICRCGEHSDHLEARGSSRVSGQVGEQRDVLEVPAAVSTTLYMPKFSINSTPLFV